MKKLLTFLTIVVFGTTLGLLISRFIFVTQNNAPKQTNNGYVQQEANLVNSKWKKPTSTVQGFPLLKAETNELNIYDITNKKLVATGRKVMGTGGASNIGDTDALPSNALLLTAYITLDNKLFIISHETMQPTKIADDVTYITAWSPDDTKLIYYRSPSDINTAVDGMGPVPDRHGFIKDYLGGFFMFDLNTGETKNLYPLTNYLGFVGNDTLLSLHSDKLVTFNFNDFEAVYNVSKETFGFGTSQYNIARDGKKWTFTHSMKPTNDNNIIIADFPNLNGTIVESGGWADYQWPILSPDATKIIYLKGPQFSETTWSYAIQSKEKAQLTTGTPVAWINNDAVLVQETLTPKAAYPYYQGLKMVNVTTKESTWLVKDLGFTVPHTL